MKRIQKDMTFWGEVKDGKLRMNSPERLRQWISRLEGVVSLTIRERKKKRTNLQNAYYWLCLTVIGDELGYTKEEMHDTFKAMFNVDMDMVAKKQTGEVIEVRVVRSTTVLNTAEFCDYFDKIQKFANEAGILLPEPNPEPNGKV